MKLINKQLSNKILNNVYDKVLEHAPHHNPVRRQIEENLGLWTDDDNVQSVKLYNRRMNIRDDLDETT